MIEKYFMSEISKDKIKIVHFEKSHKAIFLILRIDNLNENIKLVGSLIEYLKKNDIKWIILKNTLVPINLTIPKNTLWFQNKQTGDINCHIEDFESFYLNNLKLLIKPNIVFFEKENLNISDDDGWHTVQDKKKNKNNKVKKIIEEIDSLNIDWNNIK